MGKRKNRNQHYSGKELLARRQLDKQRQQAQENGLRQRIRNINQLKIALPENMTAKNEGGKRQWHF